MMGLKHLISEIKGDLPSSAIFIKVFLVNYLYSPRFRVLLNHRIGKYFSKSKFFLLRQVANYYKYKLVSKRSCDISYNAIVGKNLRLPHPIGIVIGDRVMLKDNIKIFQHVTLGSHGKKGVINEYPTVENGATIYAGAKIIGGITIGENAIVAANAVVLQDVPANSIAVGVPAKIKNKAKE